MKQQIINSWWRVGFVLLLLICGMTMVVSAATPVQSSIYLDDRVRELPMDEKLAWMSQERAEVGAPHVEVIESKTFKTGYQVLYTYRPDGQWHPGNVVVWTPRIIKENPRSNCVQAPYDTGNNAENYRKISGWTQRVSDIDAAMRLVIINGQYSKYEAVINECVVDGLAPARAAAKLVGVVGKTENEIKVYLDDAQQYINNIYGAAMMMGGLQTG